VLNQRGLLVREALGDDRAITLPALKMDGEGAKKKPWPVKSGLLVFRMGKQAYSGLNLSICGGSDLSHLAAFSSAEGSTSGRTMRKPRN